MKMIYQIFDKAQKDEARWSWRLFDGDKKVVAVSEELFTKGEIVSSIKKLRVEVSAAEIFNVDSSNDTSKGLNFEYFKDEDNWHWRLNHDKEEIAKGIVPNDIFTGEDVDDTVEGWVKDIREIMAKAKIEWENKEDDPADKEKDDDNTPTKGLPGS